MAHNGGFEMIRRQRRHDHLEERQLGGLLDGLGGILGLPGSGGSSGGGSSSGGSSGGGSSGTGSGGGSNSGSGGNGGNGGNGGSGGTGSSGSSSGGSSGTSSPSSGNSSGASNSGGSGNGGVAQSSNGAAATSAAGGAGGAGAGAGGVTSAAAAGATASATAFSTSIITKSDGSVATSLIPIGPVPSSNPFGNVAIINGSTTSVKPAPSTIIVPPGGLNNGTTTSSDSGSNNNNKIIIPVAVVGGVLILGLLIALLLRRQRKSMEQELKRPNMMSNKDTLIAASTGTLGFTAAGMFTRNRRGSDYGKSSHGHGMLNSRGGDHVSWLAGRPLSEAIASGSLRYEDDSSSLHPSIEHQTVEMTNAEMASAAATTVPPPAMGVNNNNNNNSNDYNVYYNSGRSNDSHRQSIALTGEDGGYQTASEEGGPMHGSYFDHNNQPREDVVDGVSSQNHYDGSANYGYSNPATKGLDAAAVQGATGGQMLSPYPALQRGNNNDPRASIANTEYSSGQAYDGADLDDDPFNPIEAEEARPNPHYDGNRVMMHPKSNSSRWSG